MLKPITSFMPFYETAQHAWNRLPKEKLATVAKVVVVAAVLLVLYKAFRYIQLSQERVQQPDNKPPENKANDQNAAIDLEDVLFDELGQVVVFADNKLELFNQQLPGAHLACTYTHQGQTIETNFRDYLAKFFFRTNEVSKCTYDESNRSFTLTYHAEKCVVIEKLPEAIAAKVSESALLSQAINGILSYKPVVQFSGSMQITLSPTDDDAIKIEFHETAIILQRIVALGGWYTFSAYLKSITIPNAEDAIRVESEHTSSIIPKAGYANHQVFVENVSALLFSGQ